MRIDVINVFKRHTKIPLRVIGGHFHRAITTFSPFRRGSDMVRIAAHAETNQFRINVRAARPRLFGDPRHQRRTI